MRRPAGCCRIAAGIPRAGGHGGHGLDECWQRTSPVRGIPPAPARAGPERDPPRSRIRKSNLPARHGAAHTIRRWLAIASHLDLSEELARWLQDCDRLPNAGRREGNLSRAGRAPFRKPPADATPSSPISQPYIHRWRTSWNFRTDVNLGDRMMRQVTHTWVAWWPETVLELPRFGTVLAQNGPRIASIANWPGASAA